MELLLATGKVSIKRKDIHGRSVLSRASTREATLLLLNEGADPNDYDCDGRTPLSYAVEDGQRSKVEVLLQHPEINIDMVDRNGNTPLFYVGSLNSGPVTRDNKYLEYERSNQVAGERLKGEEDLRAMAELLVSYGADLHITNSDGQTALFPAVSHHHKALVAFLQQAGLSMDKQDNDGMTPTMHLSVHSNHTLSPFDQELEELFNSKLLNSTLLNSKLFCQPDRQFEDESHDDLFDAEEETLGMSINGIGLGSARNPFPQMENALYSIGLSRKQLSSVPVQMHGNIESPNIFGPFDEIERVHQNKVLDEKPIGPPVLGRRFPTQN
ncbi:ankyrin repeat-containing domain protein [Aspergillus caelatus]|uniref:Ankyrin repeat-containing domain protein n=1 Tax=Aspergillus caelatus TaxID=61420 RepID=A0A5N7AGG2_9EURO|nr:ankyrin repeat-containing domain protein [Aspergillus caelatus]KAE8368967.1 ankyrin repeat-containing domain protein [Aspergillus caelatus]